MFLAKTPKKDNQPYMMRGSVNQTLKDSFPFSQFCGLRYQARSKTFLIPARQPIIKIGILTQPSSLLSFIVFRLSLIDKKLWVWIFIHRTAIISDECTRAYLFFYSLLLMSLWRSNDDFQQENQNNDFTINKDDLTMQAF